MDDLKMEVSPAYQAAKPLKFEEDALDEIERLHLVFGVDLAQRAVQVARRDGANRVLIKHVADAARELRGRGQNRLASALGQLGGIAIGIGGAGIYTIASTTSPSIGLILGTIVVLVGGTALVAYFTTITFRR